MNNLVNDLTYIIYSYLNVYEYTQICDTLDYDRYFKITNNDIPDLYEIIYQDNEYTKLLEWILINEKYNCPIDSGIIDNAIDKYYWNIAKLLGIHQFVILNSF